MLRGLPGHDWCVLQAVALLACGLGLTVVGDVFAGVFDTNGFEGYTLNSSLEGQFEVVENSSSTHKWLSAGDGLGTAMVQDAISESGKAVKVTRASNSDDRWAIYVGDLDYPHYRNITINWDMYVAPTGATGNVFGPFLGVDTYDDTQGSINVLGALGVDATTGDVLYQAQGTGRLTEAGSPISFNQWHSFEIRLDFLNDRYEVIVDGGLRASDGFVDATSANFSDADIAAFAAAADGVSQSEEAVAYFDNFRVLEIVPPDFDFDGDVDGDDLSIWQGSYSVDGGGDADFDGDSDGADLLIWQQYFGYGIPVQVNSVAIPEPATLALLALSGLTSCRRRR